MVIISAKLIGVGAAGLALAAAWTTVVPRMLPSSLLDWNPAPPHSTHTMRAIVYGKNDRHLVMDDQYPQPIPRPDQVLIEVHASSVNPVDFKLHRNRKLFPLSLLHPQKKIPGADVAGKVVEVGSRVQQGGHLKVGDRVAALMPTIGSRWGAAADYAAVHQDYVAKLPDIVAYEEAAALPLVALTVVLAFDNLDQSSNKEGLETKKKILIQAGAGGVGTFAVQYAKRVLGMYVACTASSEKAELLRSLGADVVIDYRTEAFEDIVGDFDVVLDPMSWAYERRTIGATSKVLKPSGHYLNIFSSDWKFDGFEKSNEPIAFLNWMSLKFRNTLQPGSLPKYDFCIVRPDGTQLQAVMDLLAQGTIQAVIDKKFPLEELSAAHRYLEEGRATGKVVIVHQR